MKKLINRLKKSATNLISQLKKKVTNFVYRKEIKICKENPVYFINKYSGHNLYDKQEKVINTINKENCVVVKAPRQSGKTTIIKNSIVHQLTFNQQKISLCSFSYRNLQQIFDDIVDTIENLPKPFNNKIVHKTKNKIVLDNGSSLSIHDDDLYFADIIYYDEFAFFSLQQIESYFFSIGRKKQVIISTKNKESIFDSIWNESSYTGRFVPVEITFNNVPWLDKQKIIEVYGQELFEKEYS